MKRPPTEWAKIFANYASEKGLITRLYRELKKLNFSQNNEPMKKWATELNRIFSGEDIQMAKKHMKKCLPSPSTIQMLTILRRVRWNFSVVLICISFMVRDGGIVIA
jgi:hypothetical protein